MAVPLGFVSPPGEFVPAGWHSSPEEKWLHARESLDAAPRLGLLFEPCLTFESCLTFELRLTFMARLTFGNVLLFASVLHLAIVLHLRRNFSYPEALPVRAARPDTIPSEASTQSNANRNALAYPKAPITVPAIGPTRKKETSENTV